MAVPKMKNQIKSTTNLCSKKALTSKKNYKVKINYTLRNIKNQNFAMKSALGKCGYINS